MCAFAAQIVGLSIFDIDLAAPKNIDTTHKDTAVYVCLCEFII